MGGSLDDHRDVQHLDLIAISVEAFLTCNPNPFVIVAPVKKPRSPTIISLSPNFRPGRPATNFGRNQFAAKPLTREAPAVAERLILRPEMALQRFFFRIGSGAGFHLAYGPIFRPSHMGRRQPAIDWPSPPSSSYRWRVSASVRARSDVA